MFFKSEINTFFIIIIISCRSEMYFQLFKLGEQELVLVYKPLSENKRYHRTMQELNNIAHRVKKLLHGSAITKGKKWVSEKS